MIKKQKILNQESKEIKITIDNFLTTKIADYYCNGFAEEELTFKKIGRKVQYKKKKCI